MDLSIVVPCYNEEGSLPLLFSAVDDAFATSGVSYELVLVNDGSSDGTSRLLHELPTPRIGRTHRCGRFFPQLR